MDISTIVQLGFYGFAFVSVVVCFIYKLINIAKKSSNGEDVSTDIEQLSNDIGDALANLFIKKNKNTGVSVDTDTVKATMKSTAKVLLNTSNQMENKNNEV